MIQTLLAGAATEADFRAARTQMALSLGWHIVLACFGVGMPALVLLAEWRGQRTGDAAYRLLARRWARAMGVLFAVGAVSGTILSFEMGVLWPGLMGTYGQVIGLPFALEGIAFFIEAIFLGIWLYAWDRLPPAGRLLAGVPVLVAGTASAFFVVTANAWMNQPTGFTTADGVVVDVRPWRAMFNAATPPQTTHMILAAFMVAGFGTASVYAVAMLRGRRDRYHRLGLTLPLVLGAVIAPVQVAVGDWAAKFLGHRQPVKLAAIEGLRETTAGASLSVGGWFDGERMRYAIRIPDGLSLLATDSPHGVVRGLDEVPRDQQPPVNIVHWSFQGMVGAGSALLLLGLWFGVVWWRRRDLPRTAWFLRAVAVSGVAAVFALEAGWVTTEVGRQPWVVYGLLRTEDAINPAPGLSAGLYGVAVVYALLTVATVVVLRRMTRSTPIPVAPQESDVTEVPVT
jgi:cytochrome d ubiquinol oxidase subunit I